MSATVFACSTTTIVASDHTVNGQHSISGNTELNFPTIDRTVIIDGVEYVPKHSPRKSIFIDGEEFVPKKDNGWVNGIDLCEKCPNNPKNGGTGICNCVIPSMYGPNRITCCYC